MKKICTVLATGAALAGAPRAFAQEDAPALAFQGPRVEVLLGYDHATGTSTKDIDTSANFNADGSGLLFGGGVGYDAALSNRVTLGAEAEVTGSTAKWTASATPDTFNLTRLRAGRDLYVGTRVGYALSDATLLYLKAGYTNARYDLTGSYPTATLTQSKDLDGWRLGAGVEEKLSKNTFAKLEYRYSKYGSSDYSYGGSTPDASTFNLGADRHQVAASFGVRF
ncbi:MAG: hypothetical protein RIS94_1351 [Pseudomonadota bacterium]